MKIVIPGGSGQVGTVLGRAFQRDGHAIVVISRQSVGRPWRVVSWDGATLGDWSKELDGCDAVINLAGRSVNCRYTPENRKAILESRVLSTRGVPIGLPATRLMLEMGAVFMRTETELMLKSRRVISRRLLEHGFTFKYPIWRDAALDLYRRWKVARRGRPMQ